MLSCVETSIICVCEAMIELQEDIQLPLKIPKIENVELPIYVSEKKKYFVFRV